MKPDVAVAITKRILDLAVGFAGTVVFLAAYPFIAWWIKRDSPGPALQPWEAVGMNRRNGPRRQAGGQVFSQGPGRNAGRRAPDDAGGRLFRARVFRITRTDPQGNAEVTKVGRRLEALRLDRLPLFWNVLKGDMSCIGPEVEASASSLRYGQKVPLYRGRTHRIRPGLISLFPGVSGPERQGRDLENAIRETHFDLTYRASMARLSSWAKMDVRIVLRALNPFRRRDIPVFSAEIDSASAAPASPDRLDIPGLAMAVVRHRDVLKPALVLTGDGHAIPVSPEGAFAQGEKVDLCIRPGSQLRLEDVDAMLRWAEAARRGGGRVTVKNSHPGVARLLRETHLDKLIEVERPSSQIANFLTVDVECWFHAHNLGIPRSSWESLPTKVVENVGRITALLKAHDAKATFFVLGWVADHFPEVVELIEAGGHEIATHGYHHEKITDMSPYQFERDLDLSLNALARRTRRKIIGHRASNFSVVDSTLWALEILVKYGIQYDSSIFPVRRSRYGIPGYPNRMPHVIELPSGASIREIPLSTFDFAGRAWPAAGGGYLRLYPYAFTEALIRRRNLKGCPVTVYFHPWELDSQQQRVGVGGLKGFQHYVNLDGTERKIHRLLERFRFTSVEENLDGKRIQGMLARAHQSLPPASGTGSSGTWDKSRRFGPLPAFKPVFPAGVARKPEWATAPQIAARVSGHHPLSWLNRAIGLIK